MLNWPLLGVRKLAHLGQRPSGGIFFALVLVVPLLWIKPADQVNAVLAVLPPEIFVGQLNLHRGF
jgi:hypothetical protein